MTINELSGSYSDLTDVQRQSLADLLEIRNDFLGQQQRLNEMRISVLANPTAEGERQLNNFALKVLTPLRQSLRAATKEITQDAINVEQLLSTIPTVVALLMGSVNVAQLLAALDIEPDMIEEFIDTFKEHLGGGRD